MSDAVRTTLESGGTHPHHDEHVPSKATAWTDGNEKPKTEWSAYMRNVYAGRKPPSIGSYDVAKLEERAREATEGYHAAYMYTFGSAGSSSTNKANLKALQQWKIIPRMLRDASTRSLETTLFGNTYKSPVLVAPVGVQGILHKDGELATARAAAKVGVPFIMSTASTRPPEEVAEANGVDGARWYQLYWPHTDEITLSLLSRVKKAGFTALVVTLDTMLLGWRPHDLDTAYLPFAHGVGIQVGTSDPVFMKKMGLEARTGESAHCAFPFDPEAMDKKRAEGDPAAIEGTKLGMAWLAETNSGMFKTWGMLKLLRDNWEGPIVLKGIQSVEDALLAMENGMDGIVVSNHGGRQVDGAIPSFLALEEITANNKVREAQERGKFTVLFDSGIRTGSDVLKAIAMGAQGVLLARPFMYGLAINGEQGVEEVLRGLLADTEITMGLSGYSNLKEIWARKEKFMRKVDAGLV
ncbi:FMN-dependent alpha-hydroxy acid dehydrogenase [Stereum hirsutum FP-91666 SS1]|uniref:FMN-dependent alpha-hydroxy acid dehydrogenase n=1 Tax=Stereum hirsutum (strain FP-91666) TaxID=721885 RepID=UPI0004449C65|nr:FMN-dependent alpha-hydroxy acid dehydrogenase [Stereum hirsutum FP-91666 SS1]EIM86179.1 FMN-dependent alpha-hydroxy acid dehydrogenase [Stereum hirsutum FP-91666 SS1]